MSETFLLIVKVDTVSTSRTDLACQQILDLANQLRANVETVWNGVTVVARPGMTVDDVMRQYGWGEKMQQFPDN